jgi:hypothetical protein
VKVLCSKFGGWRFCVFGSMDVEAIARIAKIAKSDDWDRVLPKSRASAAILIRAREVQA